jgi:hypothetical protein
VNATQERTEGSCRCMECGAVIAWEGEEPEDCLVCGALFPASGRPIYDENYKTADWEDGSHDRSL